MDLLIAVVSYNTRDLLADCLLSVFAGLERSGLSGEVWVVDNASQDGSADMVRQRFPRAHLVAHPENLGFAAGNNLALALSGFPFHKADSWRGVEEESDDAVRVTVEGAPISGLTPRHVLFLNPDTRIVDNALGAMVDVLDRMPGTGAVGGRLVHADGRFQHSAFAFPGLIQIFFDFFPVHHRLLNSRLNGRYPRSLYEGSQPFAVDHPLGAALMIRAEALAAVGGFDQQYFMYCEEIDLCRRVKAAGWEIYCVPSAEIVHWAGQSTRQFRNKMFVALWRSRFRMFAKHESLTFQQVARWLVRAGLWLKARQAKVAHERGTLSAAELEARLTALGEVARL